MYLNYHNRHVISSSIETVESLHHMTRKEKKDYIKEYNKADSNFYLSSRATKDYYLNNKKVNKNACN